MRYCEKCKKNVSTHTITKNEKYTVYGEEICVDARILVCDECGEELFDEELDEQTLTKAYMRYREIHKFLSPDEIREIREMYGLSQRGFSRILGWGDKTIYRYENGSLQDRAHDTLLTMLKNPDNMKTIVIEKEVIDKEKNKEKLLSIIDELTKNRSKTIKRDMIINAFPDKESIENGYKTFDYDKYCSMIQFFAGKSQQMPKVKLMKLMFYSDFLSYKEKGVSISGCRYAHMKLGPVPEKHDFLFGMMEESGFSYFDIQQFENGQEMHQIVINQPIISTLTSDELQSLDCVQNYFSSFGSKDIRDYSHEENGYKDTQMGDFIPYSYANELRL